MKIVVTGGAGFIGSALVRYLIGHTDHHVLVIDKLTYAGNLASLASVQGHPRYHFSRTDICDRPAVADIFSSFRPDAVMHLAAESHVDRSIDGPAEFINTNIIGTYILLEVALAYWRKLGSRAQGFRFLDVSTDEVYGPLKDEGCFTEETRYDPRSPYSATKAASDHLVRAWNHTYALPILLTNCSNNYGPYQFPEKLIPLTIIKGLAGEPMPVYGRGLNVRDWLFVDDHAQALTLVLERGRVGETYNIGGNAERRNIDVVGAICDAMDELTQCPTASTHRKLITFVADRPGHDFRYAMDFSKLNAELGWSPKHSFGTGLPFTVKWYLENRAWWEPLLCAHDADVRRGLSKKSASRKRLLLFGGTGQVGQEFRALSLPNDVEIVAPSRRELDLEDARAISRIVAAEAWTAVINAAAYTDVDRAESEQSVAFAVNAEAPARLAAETARHGIPLVHISTDYVFDGRKGAPYVEGDAVAPLNAYGRSKLAGERGIRAANSRHVILRTSWVYSPYRKNFVRTILRLAAERERLTIVADQRGCPTAAADIAKTCLDVALYCASEAEQVPYGIYHFAGAGEATWFEFARTIVDLAADRLPRSPQVLPIRTIDYPTPAVRAADTRLDCTAVVRAFGIRPRSWRQALADTIDRLLPNKVIA